jgi:hypothetical protein
MSRLRPTPVGILESHFDVPLERSSLRFFDEVSDEAWIDFAKAYRSAMDDGFAEHFLSDAEETARVRLYFEPRMAHHWARAVEKTYAPTPLLGLKSEPDTQSPATRAEVSTMLDPLKKHLLLADSVYVRDSFYYCFDWVADSLVKATWQEDVNTVALVESSVRGLKRWLPILAELRDLIESEALVFMPYYLTPSFPYMADSPALAPSFAKLRSRAPATPPPEIDFDKVQEYVRMLAAGTAPVEQVDDTKRAEYYRPDDVLGAWLNARILSLDPVFPTRGMFDWAADLYFEDDPGAADLVGDLISVDVLPFGGTQGMSLDDLISIRKNDEVFEHVRRAVADCKTYLETNVGPESTRAGVTAACKTYLGDRLDELERNSFLRFVDDSTVAGIAFSIAVGAALLPLAAAVPPAVGLIAGAVLTPQVGLVVRRRFDPERRAIGRLQALL